MRTEGLLGLGDCAKMVVGRCWKYDAGRKSGGALVRCVQRSVMGRDGTQVVVSYRRERWRDTSDGDVELGER